MSESERVELHVLVGSEHEHQGPPKQPPISIGQLVRDDVLDDLLVVESCQSVWMFNESERLYCRVARGDLGGHLVPDWRNYDRLVLHPLSDAFVVFLDPANTRVLRSWRHQEPCPRCGGEVTSEMSVVDLIEELDR